MFISLSNPKVYKLEKTSKSLYLKSSTHQFKYQEQYQLTSQSYPSELIFNEILRISNSWISIFLQWTHGQIPSKIPSKKKQKEKGWHQQHSPKFNFGDQEVHLSATSPSNLFITQYNTLKKDFKHSHKLRMDLEMELLMTLLKT